MYYNGWKEINVYSPHLRMGNYGGVELTKVKYPHGGDTSRNPFTH
jgi:hypothetical protein